MPESIIADFFLVPIAGVDLDLPMAAVDLALSIEAADLALSIAIIDLDGFFIDESCLGIIG